MPSKRAIVCTVVDARKWSIILDSSRVYLKGSPFYVSEDRTPKQQEARRRQHAEQQKIYLKGSPFYVSEDPTPKQQEARRRQYATRQKRQGKAPSIQEANNVKTDK